jgi:hypothetical protein
VSNYYWKVRKLDPRPTFDEWLERIDESRRPRLSDWGIYGDGDDVAVDRVIRFENLGAELAEVLEHVGLDSDEPLPRFKAGHRKGHVEFSPWARDQVRQLFSHEIRYFGYPDEPPEAV